MNKSLVDILNYVNAWVNNIDRLGIGVGQSLIEIIFSRNGGYISSILGKSGRAGVCPGFSEIEDIIVVDIATLEVNGSTFIVGDDNGR